MNTYLGEFPCPTSDVTAAVWALFWIELHGQTDGEHHKAWVLDQVARILCGTPVIATMARRSNGQSDVRYRLGAPHPEYLRWVQIMRADGDEYDEGIAS